MSEELSEIKSLKDTKKLLLKWKNDKNIQELKKFYDTKSFSGILGVERREMSHSNFIAWILNDTESHNLGQFAIRQLFDMLLEYGEDKIKNSLEEYNQINKRNLQFDNLYKALMLNSYIIKDLNIGVERVLTGGRIDIIVSMMIRSDKKDIELPEKVNIIIENKVDSSEHSSQTKTYYKYYTKDAKYEKDLNLFVFLLPVSTSKLFEPLAECEHFININYQLLSDNIFERALNHDISDRVKFMITEYLLSLRKPSKENKGHTMATGTLEKELLKEFWETNKDLLVSLFPIIAEEEQDKDLKKTLGMVANAVKEARDNTKYTFNEIEKLAKGRLALEIIKTYANESSDITYEKLHKVLSAKIVGTDIIAKLEDAKKIYDRTNTARHFIKVDEIITTINGDKIVVSNQWSANERLATLIQFGKDQGNKIEEVN